jgi:hypothetical protein
VDIGAVILRRRLPMVMAASVPPTLVHAIDSVLDRIPRGIVAALRGRAGGIKPGWRIEVVELEKGVWGWCQPWRNRILFAPCALNLPSDALEALIAHEFCHAEKHQSAEPGFPWNDESDVNTTITKWGFDVDALFVATGLRRGRDAG